MDVKTIHLASLRRTTEVLGRLRVLEGDRLEAVEKLRWAIGRPSLSVAAKFEKLYEAVAVEAAAYAEHSPCKKGCSACCHQHVLVTEAEAKLLAKKLGRSLKRVPVGNRRGADAANAANEACPFLAKGVCSIYAGRPFMCRHHRSVDETNFWCQPSNQARGDYQIGWPRFLRAISIYTEISGGHAAAETARDIRDWF